MLITLLFTLGLALLLIGGELLVRASLGFAHIFKLSKMVVGIVLIGFCTSAPEFVVTFIAVMRNHAGTAIGNIIGSNIANIGLILGATALITPILSSTSKFLKDEMCLLIATLALLPIAWFGYINFLVSLIFLSILALYLFVSIKLEKNNTTPDENTHAPKTFTITVFFLILGLSMLVGGAELLVDSATKIATYFGLPNYVIGLTIIAIGTSLPELVFSIVAAFKQHAELAVGNVIGSNIYNILFCLSLPALFKTYQFDLSEFKTSIAIMLGFTGFLITFNLLKLRVSQLIGILLLIIYLLYIGLAIFL